MYTKEHLQEIESIAKDICNLISKQNISKEKIDYEILYNGTDDLYVLFKKQDFEQKICISFDNPRFALVDIWQKIKIRKFTL